MYYTYKIEYYEEDGLYVTSGVVYANCYADALDKLDTSYDVSTLHSVTLERGQEGECYEINCHRKENH